MSMPSRGHTGRRGHSLLSSVHHLMHAGQGWQAAWRGGGGAAWLLRCCCCGGQPTGWPHAKFAAAQNQSKLPSRATTAGTPAALRDYLSIRISSSTDQSSKLQQQGQQRQSQARQVAAPYAMWQVVGTQAPASSAEERQPTCSRGQLQRAACCAARAPHLPSGRYLRIVKGIFFSRSSSAAICRQAAAQVNADAVSAVHAALPSTNQSPHQHA